MNISKHPGLYIHIPFCQSKCGYCDFYSVVNSCSSDSETRGGRFNNSSKNNQISQFVEALKTEISLIANDLNKIQPFDTIYFGGGTPSILKTDQIQCILEHLYHCFKFTDNCEVTIEVNPGTVNAKILEKYRQIGINRISIGVQSFVDTELKYLERIHTSDQAIISIESVRTAGFDNINIDLIFAIPGQTLSDWQHSLEKLQLFQPEHIAIYNLSYEKGTPFYERIENGQIRPMDEVSEEKYFNQAHKMLKKSGYIHYEISNYAKTDTLLSRHNYKYWDHTSYLGFGPSAHSFWANQRWENIRSLTAYTKRLREGKRPKIESEILSNEQLIFEYIFLSLRTYRGLHLPEFFKRFFWPLLFYRFWFRLPLFRCP